ncbi:MULTISPECIES: CPBP family intramembrane glutamic endopeptidase [Brevibacterium]|uniref:CAAX prenyl protease 2/Lysostaphin resistance protein A-like domain-containing protein n=1 Tax=Brevibacterium casei S18 TaxID=1229781 RepID=K9AYF8_9MICO|nr:CPBP family glutamic-type intramembrane protease [Brevibacterium casei]EKU47597.1 hypothetical protein C272_07627 [Brevibacterium casei S18]
MPASQHPSPADSPGHGLPVPTGARDARPTRRVIGVVEILVIAGLLSVFGFAFNAIGILPLLALGITDTQPWTLPDGSGRALGYLVAIVATVGIIAIYLRRRLGVGLKAIGLTRPRWGSAVIGLLVGAAVSAGGTAIAWSGGWVHPAEPATLPSGIVLAVVAVLYLVTYIAQGAGEEVVARGLLLRGTSWWIGLGPAVVLQALFFLAIHVGNPGFTPLYGAFVLSYAIFAGLLVVWQRHLWGAIGVHGGYNVVFFAVDQRGLGLRDVGDTANLSFPDIASTPFFALGAIVLGILLYRRRGGAGRARDFYEA